MNHKYWWDFHHDPYRIVVQSMKNAKIEEFMVDDHGAAIKAAEQLVADLEAGRIRVTSSDEIKH